jgi:hypothetical protein
MIPRMRIRETDPRKCLAQRLAKITRRQRRNQKGVIGNWPNLGDTEAHQGADHQREAGGTMMPPTEEDLILLNHPGVRVGVTAETQISETMVVALRT